MWRFKDHKKTRGANKAALKITKSKSNLTAQSWLPGSRYSFKCSNLFPHIFSFLFKNKTTTIQCRVLSFSPFKRLLTARDGDYGDSRKIVFSHRVVVIGFVLSYTQHSYPT